jgi:hypothetical protein
MTNAIHVFLRRVIWVAAVVCPVFLVIMAGYWISGLHEDFPEPSFWDPAAGFFLGFPALFVTRFVAPFGLSQASYVFVGVAIDGLFWAFAGVMIYHGLRSSRLARPHDVHH